MPVPFKQLTEFFLEEEADNVSHSNRTYLAHAIGVYNDLKEWGFDEAFARVGLFHSIYGTEGFQGFTLPLERRNEIRELIGESAELLCYLNCAMDRRTVYDQLGQDKSEYEIHDRLTGESRMLDRSTFDDLCSLHLCDWLEQVERSDKWDFQRDEFSRMAAHLGGIAQQRYDKVFAKEPAGR